MADVNPEDRQALSDAAAHLRPSYPRDAWNGHANFGELSRFWLHVHDSLRQQGQQLEQLTERFREGQVGVHDYGRMLASGLNHFLGHLNGHHQIEDRHYFPKFRALDARIVPGFELLEQDHAHIHDALLGSAEAANRFLSALGSDSDAVRRASDVYSEQATRLLRLLIRHLADEEDLIIPAMLHHGERSVS